MEPELVVATPPARDSGSGARFIFFNERGLRAGWRIAIFTGIMAVLLGIVGIGFVLYKMARGASPQPAVTLSPLGVGISDLISFLLLLLASFIMTRIERRPLCTYGLPMRHPRLSQFVAGWVFWGFLPLTLLLLAMRGLNVFYFGNLALHGAEILRYAILWAFAFLCVGLFEEYFTRGYLLYTLADGIGFWPAAIVLAVGFALLHVPNHGETRIGLIDVSLFAIFAATTLRLTGNLWLAVGAHAGWDWGQSFFYGVNDSGTPAVGHLLSSHIQGPDWLSGGSVGPEGSVLSSLLLILMTILFFALYRERQEDATVIQKETSPAPPPL